MNEPTLTSLLGDAPATLATGADAVVSGIAYRSDAVRPGDVFFCVPGLVHDGHDFAADAVARGAAAVVAMRPLPGLDVPTLLVEDPRAALAIAAARFFGDPSTRFRLVGITGTNGKTTTAYLVESILRAAGHITGLIGTVETRVAGRREEAGRTTPESADLQALFARMLDRGVTAGVMEVSSHALDLHRVDGVRFAVAAFTNLSQDHLDYHGSLEEYYDVKRRLFADIGADSAVVDIDDSAGARLASEISVGWTVGRSEAARVGARDERRGPVSTEFDLVTPRGTRTVRLPLAGAYNVSNALVAAGCGLALDIGIDRIVEGLEAVEQVPGRLERIDEGQPFAVLVDYAHTPDALEKALRAVREVTAGRVLVVFGCGGDRDPEKRPMMGEAAGRAADIVFLTSDNPRSEDPQGIILRVEEGLRRCGGEYRVQVDRRTAIADALSAARPGDAVLIAGKGHEDHQIFADRTVHFDDREVAREELRGRC